jgi:hypothetical protein
MPGMEVHRNFGGLDGPVLTCIPSERATLMLSMSLYVLGPMAALVVASVLYVVERGPIIGVRWLDFLEKLESRRERRRRRGSPSDSA